MCAAPLTCEDSVASLTPCGFKSGAGIGAHNVERKQQEKCLVCDNEISTKTCVHTATTGREFRGAYVSVTLGKYGFGLFVSVMLLKFMASKKTLQLSINLPPKLGPCGCVPGGQGGPLGMVLVTFKSQLTTPLAPSSEQNDFLFHVPSGRYP